MMTTLAQAGFPAAMHQITLAHYLFISGRCSCSG